MATPFGKFVRKRRIELDLTLRKMAKALNMSSAYLSAIETGRRRIREEILEEIKTYLNLDEKQNAEIDELVPLSQPEVRIPMTSTTQSGREVALALARNLNKLGESELQKMKDILGSK